jgi:hypothetical protein
VWEAKNRRILVQVGMSKMRDLISKITREKRAGDMAQAVDHLPCKCEALSSHTKKTPKNLNQALTKLLK